jgi:hypothetical protein
MVPRTQRDVIADTRQELFGERGPLVRKVKLLPQEHDTTVEPLGAQCLGAADTRETGADYHD